MNHNINIKINDIILEIKEILEDKHKKGFFNKTYEKNRLKQEKKSKENIIKRKFKSLFE